MTERHARELRKLGYEYLACETFDTAPPALSYINRKTGYYSNDPLFANFLREARQDHWTFVPYEETSGQRNPADPVRSRELTQAKNLNERIFLKHPKAKVFIYVGYGHNLKKPVIVDGEEDARMAAATKCSANIGTAWTCR